MNNMTQEEQEEQREQIIQQIADMLRTTQFSVEFAVNKNPKGIRIIHEVTQEQMNEYISNAKKGM